MRRFRAPFSLERMWNEFVRGGRSTRGVWAQLLMCTCLVAPFGIQPQFAVAQEPLAATAAPAIDLKFSQFVKTPIGPRGLELSEVLRAADGQRVQLVGYMVVEESPQPGRFWLTPRPVRMSEHADGDADDLPPSTVTVVLDPCQQQSVPAHREGLVALTGTLSVGRYEDPQTGRVSWVRLQLPREALATEPSSARAPAHAH